MCSMPLRNPAVFGNELELASEDDVEGLAAHLYAEFTEFRDPIDQARHLPNPKHRPLLLRKVVHGSIETLVRRGSAPTVLSSRTTESDPAQTQNNVATTANNMLALLSPDMLKKTAAAKNISVEELRQQFFEKFQRGERHST